MKNKELKKLLVIFLLLISVFQVQNSFSAKPPKAKYVFLFIGDGMGMAHVSLTEAYLKAIQDSIGFQKLTMSQFPVFGLSTTYAETRLTTCSAAAGTAIATGIKTSINTIGLSADYSDTLYSIAYFAKKQGFKVGILTSVSINHATPAAFYAHQSGRGDYFDIALQMSVSNFDVFGGGGIYKNKKDNKDAYEILKQSGYQLVGNTEDFKNLKNNNQKVFMYSSDILSDASLPFAIDRQKNAITLADYTQKAIELLYNPNGFFMMVEGGKIDWAAHSNDASAMIEEVIDFDNAIKKAYEFYKLHPNETLIIVTADHETGGLALGWDALEYDTYLKLLSNQKGSVDRFNDTINNFVTKNGIKLFSFEKMLSIGSYFFDIQSNSLTPDEILLLAQGYKDFVDAYVKNPTKDKAYDARNSNLSDSWLKIKSHRAGVAWTTHSHTASPVPVRAIGQGQELFTGMYDNTDISKKIAQIMGLNLFLNNFKTKVYYY